MKIGRYDDVPADYVEELLFSTNLFFIHRLQYKIKRRYSFCHLLALL